jgi:lipoyl(octanoyl) transferase
MTTPALATVGPLEVFLLGETPLDEILRLQRQLIYDQGERAGGALILCEHPPTITVGRSGSRAHITLDDEELRESRLSVRWINRGGGCILHLPGQIAGYLVLGLDSLELNLGRYLELLTEILIDTLAEFDLHARTWPERPGIFLNHSRVASVGIALTRGITYHGFTLNVGTYLSPFSLLEEPGLEGRPLRQTSMEAQRQRAASMPKVRESLMRNVEFRLGLERHHVYTDHPLIRPKVRAHAHVLSLG